MSRFIALATICLLFMSMGPPSGPAGQPPSPPAGGPNPCANVNCATQPNHPCCQNQIPVDGYIFIPIILGLAYGTWRIYKMRKEQIV